jgi:hypothetical protein
MIEELWRRNFAESTIRAHVHSVEHFSRHFHRRPDQLGPEHIRQYQAMLSSISACVVRFVPVWRARLRLM